MGKKRVAFVAEKSEVKKSPKVRTTGLKGGERVVMVSGEEKGKKEEKLEEEEGKKEEEKKKKKRKLRIRGKKHQKSQAMIGAGKEYPLKEAIKLLKKTSISKFIGTAEAHIVVSKVGLKAKVKFPYDIGKKKMGLLGLEIKTEKKAPLIHTVFGRIDQENQKLEENLKTLISGVGKGNIRKLVICATMGPGIRVDGFLS